MGICFSSLVFADPSGGGAEKAELTLTHKRGAQDRKGGALCRLISGLNLEAAAARGSSAWQRLHPSCAALGGAGSLWSPGPQLLCFVSTGGLRGGPLNPSSPGRRSGFMQLTWGRGREGFVHRPAKKYSEMITSGGDKCCGKAKCG